MAVTARSREFHFPATVTWLDGRRVEAAVPGKAPLEITAPPEFRGTSPETWSPEDLLVGAAASCLAVTFASLAARRGLDYSRLDVEADSTVGLRPDGRFGFVRIDLTLRVTVEPSAEARAHELAGEAEDACLVSASLDLPVVLEVEVLVPAVSV
jgi:organic hydroperoxide reductase OsmC/OhrA